MKDILKCKDKKKSWCTIFFITVLIPISVWIGSAIFPERIYALTALIVVVLLCIPVFMRFEKRENVTKELTVLAVLIAISATGRFIFAWIPGFKPVTAITVITGVYLGREAGFVVGSLSAVVSNFYFGQGPWTPFQMFSWGFIGFLAGVFASHLKNKKMNLLVYGALAGILFSLIMDTWTTLWVDGSFNLARYLTLCIAALPVTIEYIISNIVFLIIMYEKIGDVLERVTVKYGLFQQ